MAEEPTCRSWGDFQEESEKNRILAETFLKNYVSVALVDPFKENAFILKAALDPDIENTAMPWNKLVERYARHRIFPNDQDAILSLTADYLKTYLLGGKENFRLRCAAPPIRGPTGG